MVGSKQPRNRPRTKPNGDERSETLRFGPYQRPEDCGIGSSIRCVYRGSDVLIGGLTDAPVPWFKIHANGKPFVIVCGDLVRAVQLESETAIAHHWGVSLDTARKWRRALNVGRMTPGSQQVFRSLFKTRMSPEAVERRPRNSKSKAAVEKMIVAKTGQPMHPNTRKALLKAVKRPKSDAHRAAISRAIIARGTKPPNGRAWKKAEDKRLGKSPDRDLATEFNRSVDSIRKRRMRLQIPRYRETGNQDA